ncbi:hypothetical protein GPALN_014775 [Globodera pallida]|nr:hypothetical protein GPALN_014775 [Globodera pallida]
MLRNSVLVNTLLLTSTHVFSDCSWVVWHTFDGYVLFPSYVEEQELPLLLPREDPGEEKYRLALMLMFVDETVAVQVMVAFVHRDAFASFVVNGQFYDEKT